MRANGCVAADFDGDGRTDLYVTAAGYDALLWNDGDGTFTEGARAAGIADFGWHAGAAVADVNGDGRQDLFVAGYTDLNAPIPGSEGGFPTDHQAVRDRLYLNEGAGANGRSRFREVGLQAGIEKTREDHGLGAVFTDVTGDGRADLYVANDADPNRLYVNVPFPGGAAADPARLGFRFEDRGREAGVADPNAGMGIAVADYDLDGRADLFVTNSHRQLHAAYRGRPPVAGRPSFADARPAFAQSLDTTLAGWGASWADLDLDGDPDLVLANGAIPVTNLAKDAEPLKVLGNLAAQGKPGQVADVSRLVGLGPGTDVIGRGLAVADYDDDGDLDVAVNSIGGRLQLLENTGARRQLAGGAAEAVRPRCDRDRRAAGRPQAPARGARGQQLPLLGGPARPLRPRRRHGGEGAARPLPRRRRVAAHEREGEPGHHGVAVRRCADTQSPTSGSARCTQDRHSRGPVGRPLQGSSRDAGSPLGDPASCAN